MHRTYSRTEHFTGMTVELLQREAETEDYQLINDETKGDFRMLSFIRGSREVKAFFKRDGSNWRNLWCLYRG